MSIVWEEGAGSRKPGNRQQGSVFDSPAGTVSVVALFALAAVILAVAALWPQAGPVAQTAKAADVPANVAAGVAETPPEPVAPTAERIAVAEPTAPAEQPLPEGSARFALDTPTHAAIARNVLAKNWRPAGTRGLGIDAANTASIEPAAGVAVAESEADVVKMEAEMAAAGSNEFDMPAAPDMVAGRALKWVNMRAAPGNDAEVITVVPYDAALMAEKDCPHWCAVTYDGRQGYIYKSLIGYDG